MSEFLTGEDQRKSRILEAALAEFASKGYKKASTNTIVREANVSKGLLFHYFISKKDLYLFIFDFAVKKIISELFEELNFADKDVLNRLQSFALIKIEIYKRHPLFTHLFEMIDLIDDEDILEEVYRIFSEENDIVYGKLFQNIDYYMFRENLNIDRCLEIVRWTVDRISADWRVKYDSKFTNESCKELKTSITNYIDVFRDSFYK